MTVADECVDKYNEIKMKKTQRWMTFHIPDKKKIQFCEEGPREDTLDDFIKKGLPEEEPRYALLDFDYQTDDGRQQTKLIFINWCLDGKVGVKQRMLYASSKDAIKKKFTGIMCEKQVTEVSDMTDQSLTELCNKK